MAGSSNGDEAQSVIQSHVATDLLVANIPRSPWLNHISAQVRDPLLSMEVGYDSISVSTVDNDF